MSEVASPLEQLFDFVNLNLGSTAVGQTLFDPFSWAEYQKGINGSSTVVIDDGAHLFAARFASPDPSSALLLFSPLHPYFDLIDTFRAPEEREPFAEYVLGLCKDTRPSYPPELLAQVQLPLL